MQTTYDGEEAELRSVLCLPNVPEIRQTLARIRPELAEDSLSFRAAIFLLAGPALNFNVDRLAGRTHCPRAIAAACARRLFDNGVWQADGSVYTWKSPDDEHFWNDVAVAEGKLCRRTDRFGCIEWAAPGAWRKAYDFGTADPALTVSYFADGESGRPVKAQPEPMAPKGSRPQPAQETVPASVPASLGQDWLGTPAIAAIGATQPLHLQRETSSAFLTHSGAGNLFPGAVWLS
jgi:hypothetical protein